MAMEETGQIPFGAIVGPLNDIPWDESAIAYAVFYNRLLKEGNAYKALEAMNYASGGINFGTTPGVHARDFFLHKLQEAKFQQFQEQLRKLGTNKKLQGK